MKPVVLDFQEMHKTHLSLAGGKGLNLGELSTIEGIQVPEGFCVTTAGYQEAIEQNRALLDSLEQLTLLQVENRKQISELSKKIRQIIMKLDVPSDVAAAVSHYLSKRGDNHAYAVRSSATAEDLPHASFAGQHDSYLNIIGLDDILLHIRKCWASLYTDRAVIYRIQNGFDHSKVSLAVVVQKMVLPSASGIVFTADPVTSNRKLLSIDASFGLGEALVSGKVSPDCYKVQDENIKDKRIATKKLGIYGQRGGGTETRQIDFNRQNTQTLTDQEILQLAHISRTIERHFGCPQDIEWCLFKNTFYVVQSRPITTLYPIPDANDDENHVYISVGHQQMMTAPIKPLGLSFFLLTTNAPMRKAGGRLFVDVTHHLASSVRSKILLDTFEQSDPLIRDALETITQREGFIKSQPSDTTTPEASSTANRLAQIHSDETVVLDLIQQNQASINQLKQDIRTKSGPALLDFIREDIKELKRVLFDPQSSRVFMAAIHASSWVNKHINEWLGEKNAVDTLSRSVPNNITSDMGLALLDLADAIRPYAEVVDYLQQVKEDTFLDNLVQFVGGRESRDAIYAFLTKYGMRCDGEIDITRTRWSENPVALVPIILNNIKNFESHASNRIFDQGRQKALKKEQELLERLQRLPGGQQKMKDTKRAIHLIRNFIGYREYPKYGMVSRYFVYKQALLGEAERLVKAGVIVAKEDIYYLTFEELDEVVRTHKLDYHIIDRQKDAYEVYERLTPPRVMTSDGEIIRGLYKRENVPPKAIAGLPVSSGVVEGRARVILNMEDAHLEEGDILVTAFTDPGWTPLFVSSRGLITEVGGIMTHGAVIAREYGLPAVVGVENATKRIQDGQKIRLNGTEGYIDLL
ncbi:phosphoenolpyruvate synthase [Alicyclobacillus sp. SO9]|uniref:phosphoenolpyruvate synthase n=1 Tax=Alicyclobacillus sp. SO9 TaxID=2665646 RepID=UPI0018E6F494|nr:phosphoenolpyruvate synthase [Alicyclobacillus sp. SO9]QQE80033.1 phosphoenolpyruvate synthase [Alicyclobacillus sp. SO9]